MPKANRTCYCCGRKYYYCTSCPDDRRDPRIYVMWDSELCREIFSVLSNESAKKITTLECKEKLIELGVTKETVLKESVRKHVDRVMSYEEEVVKVEEMVSDSISEETIALEETTQVEEQNEIVFESEPKIELEFETEEVIVDTMTIQPIVAVEKTEYIKKTKRTKKSSLKNKENSEVD